MYVITPAAARGTTGLVGVVSYPHPSQITALCQPRRFGLFFNLRQDLELPGRQISDAYCCPLRFLLFSDLLSAILFCFGINLSRYAGSGVDSRCY